MKRLEVINGLIKAQGLKGYLEIGVGLVDTIFDLVQVEDKQGVDPAVVNQEKVHAITSDMFFSAPDVSPDIVFVDGDHSYEQALADILNSYKLLPIGGWLVVHDVMPKPEETGVRADDQVDWCGDAWKAWNRVLHANPHAVTVAADHGIGIIQKKSEELKLLDLENVGWQSQAIVEGGALPVQALVDAGVLDLTEAEPVAP